MPARSPFSALRRVALLLPLLCMAWSDTPAQTSPWTRKADLPNATPSERSYPVSFTIGGKGYMGLGTAGQMFKDFWEYDPVSNGWTQRADYPGPGYREMVGFAIGSNGYVGLGNSGSHEFWRFDPAANTWLRRTDYPGSTTSGCVNFGIGNRGFVGLGHSSANGTTSGNLYEYNPNTDAWTAKTSAPFSDNWSSGFVAGTKCYVGATRNLPVAPFYEYDVSTDSWTSRADFPGPRRLSAPAFSIGGYGYIGFGDSATRSSYKDLWRYDTSADSWTLIGNFPGEARTAPVCFAIGASAFIGMGERIMQNSGRFQSDFYEFRPDSGNRWTLRNRFRYTDRLSAYTFSIGGKGYAGGGFQFLYPGVSCFTDFYEYDPAGNTWSQRASLPDSAGRRAFSFALSGRGYICDERSRYYSYDPAANSWTRRTDFPGAPRIDGIGFVLGSKGYGGTGRDTGRSAGGSLPDANVHQVYSDFWAYDPVSDSWSPAASFGGGPRYGAVGFAVGPKGYAGTGAGSLSASRDFWEYDPIIDRWTQKASYPGPKTQYGTGFALTGSGALGSGTDSADGGNDSFWEYLVANNTWVNRTDPVAFPARKYASSFSNGGKGYVFTGFNYGLPSSFLEYAARPSAVPEAKPEPAVRIYPNPATERVQVMPRQDYHLRLTDVAGRLLLEQHAASALNLGTLAPGAYLLEVRDGNGRLLQTEKIVKE